MGRIKPIAVLIVLATAWLGTALPQAVAGPKTAAAPDRPSETAQDEKNRQFFSDLAVITHEGQALRFYSDLLKDKLVAICFFYANCPTAQPALVTFFKLQKRLKDRIGKDILLLTISVDPDNDTPAVIQEYARKFNPQPGWLFLTGDPKNLNVINRNLGNTMRLPESHLRLFLLGNLKTGHWMKMIESAPEIALAEGLRTLAVE